MTKMMMKFQIAVIAMLFPMSVLAWPWSTDMADQPSLKPQEPINGAMKNYSERSIPVSGIPSTFATREDAKEFKNPHSPSDTRSIEIGRTLFKIYCAACHGLDGGGKAPVGQKIGAIPLTDGYVQDFLTEGWVFGTITYGSRLMPAYGVPSGREDRRGSNDLSVEERWHVVNYVKNALVKDAQEMSTTTADAGGAQSQ